jgi:hypothetical protein
VQGGTAKIVGPCELLKGIFFEGILEKIPKFNSSQGLFFVEKIMKKLWQNNKTKLNELIEIFETGEDLLLDQKLLEFDLQGSLAHAIMLQKIGLINTEELQQLKKD